VVGASDALKGQMPVAFAGSALDPDVTRPRSASWCAPRIGAIASLRDVYLVDRLPKTRSGKIMRATMRAIVDGRDYAATIDDRRPRAALEEIFQAVTGRR
jgi:propionyl-CoA synthetase